MVAPGLGEAVLRGMRGALTGLLLVEAEFDTEERMAAFATPDFALREVTDDPRFTGGHLVKHGLPKDA